MKCTNCGAELQNGDKVKFCSYCGNQVEQTEKIPKTMPGAVYGIAKGIIDEVGKQLNYNRDHADEIQERKKKKEREDLKHGLWILIVAVLLFAGLMAFIAHMAAEEKKEKQTVPTGIVYIQKKLA